MPPPTPGPSAARATFLLICLKRLPLQRCEKSRKESLVIFPCARLRILSPWQQDPCREAEGDGWPAPSSPFLQLSCQGLQIRAGGEDMTGSSEASAARRLGSTHAGASFTPDSSASWVDLWSQTALPHPRCPCEQSGERGVLF